MMLPTRVLIAAPALLLLTACADVEASPLTNPATPVAETVPAGDLTSTLCDADLPSSSARLLTVALDSASALPHEPHIKDRSRAQASVLDLCLELDQPLRALGIARRIDNWRRGLGYADLAFYCAEHGTGEDARQLIALAQESIKASDESPQGWRKDRIEIRVAQVRAIVGDRNDPGELEANVMPLETGWNEAVKDSISNLDSFDSNLAVVDTIAASSDFEQVRNGLETCSQLFDYHYDDAERRARAEAKIKQHWGRLPLSIRIHLALDLCEHALAHSDMPKGLSLVDEAQELLDSVIWLAEDEVALSARLAQARFASGDERAALQQASTALAMFQERVHEITDIYRADALRPLARAFAAMGDRETSALVYRMALEEGVHNPNSRPRAEDLTATCLSMASHDFEPGDELWNRIDEINAALAAPW